MKPKSFLKISYVFTLLFICLPFFGFFTKGNFLELQNLDASIILSSLRVSLQSSIISMAIIILIGIPSGYYMAKANFKHKSILDTLFNLPQILPPAVIGLLLLITYGNHGFIGRHLNLLGIRISFSSIAVILTFVFVSLPIFIKSVCITFSEINPHLEEIAMILGDSPFQTFRRVTLPLAKKGIIIALLLSWSRGLAEFGATMMFAGNLQGHTQTLPLAIYTALATNINNALFLAFLMFIIALIILITTQILLGRKNENVSIQSTKTTHS